MTQTNDPGNTKSKTAAEVVIREEWCKGCQYCVVFCPTDVLAMERKIAKVVNIENCTGCDLCAWICPEFAVKVNKEESNR
jgi:NAD-dependent dihydropyrimidine dehydrogenase PreA subunit